MCCFDHVIVGKFEHPDYFHQNRDYWWSNPDFMLRPTLKNILRPGPHDIIKFSLWLKVYLWHTLPISAVKVNEGIIKLDWSKWRGYSVPQYVDVIRIHWDVTILSMRQPVGFVFDDVEPCIFINNYNMITIGRNTKFLTGFSQDASNSLAMLNI